MLIHGYSRRNGNQHPLYSVWSSMKRRCDWPKHKDYHNYGGRGIKVCRRWRKSFSNFLKDMGDRPTPKHTLERMDTDGDYSKNNCKWATRSEQAYNRRHSGGKCSILIGGKTLPEISAETGVRYATLLYRYKRGISAAKLGETDLRIYNGPNK